MCVASAVEIGGPTFCTDHAPPPRIDAPPPPSSSSSNIHTNTHSNILGNIASCWTAFFYSYVALSARSVLYLIRFSPEKSTRLLGRSRSSTSNRGTSTARRAFSGALKKSLQLCPVASSIGVPEIY